jgi:Protein of unknown function (DUF3105)
MPKKPRQLAREQERIRRARQRRLIYVGAGVVAILVIVGAGLVLAAPKPPTSSQVASALCGPIEAPPDGGRAHLLPGQTPSYSSNPPASGAHNPNPQARGIYDTPIDVTMEVHSLEHGYVIIHYNAIPSGQLQQLQDIVSRDPFKMILSPYPSMPYKISLTAWDHLQTCTGVDPQAIASFVAQFRNNGPESTPM